MALKLHPLDRSSRLRNAGHRQEVAATLRLMHPNIAHMHEAGQADGVSYLALELVEGLTLAQHVRLYGPLTPAAAARALAA